MGLTSLINNASFICQTRLSLMGFITKTQRVN